MLLTCLLSTTLLADPPPETPVAAPPPAEETALPGIEEGPAPAEPGAAPQPEGPAPAPAAAAPAPSASPAAAPSAGAGVSAEAGVSAGAAVTPEPEPEVSVAKEPERDTARSHESILGLGAAALVHSARPGARSLGESPDPGLALTGELRFARDENVQLWIGAEGAYWRARHYGSTVAVRGQFGFRLIFDMGLGFDIYGGPGFAFHKYETAAQKCGCTNHKPRQTGFVGGMGGGLLYDFGQVTRMPLAVYVRYEAFIERHLGAPEFYLVPHHAVHAGLRFTIPGRRK